MSEGGRGKPSRGSSKARGGRRNQRKKNDKVNKNSNKAPRDTTAPRGALKPRGGSTKSKKANRAPQTHKGQAAPIERRNITVTDPNTGEERLTPMLHKDHALKGELLMYLPSDNNINDPGTLAALQLLNRDAKALLRLTFHEFWSTVTHNPSFSKMIDAFLGFWKSPNALSDVRGADQLYFTGSRAPPQLRPEEAQRRELFLAMWKIIYRLTHPHEGEDWMSDEHYAHLIKHGGVFTISSMIDLALHYAAYQTRDVKYMLRYLLDVQPDYGIQMGQAFAQIQRTLEQYLSNVAATVTGDTPIEGAALDETVQFLHHIATSLLVFLQVAPLEITVELTDDHKGLRDLFVHCYELAIPQLRRLLASQPEPSEMTMELLGVAASGLYGLVRHVLDDAFIMPLTKVQRMEQYDSLAHATEFLWLVRSLPQFADKTTGRKGLPAPAAEEKILYYLVDDVELANILKAFPSHFPSIPEANINAAVQAIAPFLDVVENNGPAFRVEKLENVFGGGGAQPAAAAGPSAQRLENISNVKMILEHLGDGFINECLELYNDNVEVVCDRIFSESLAEPLLELDRNMPLRSSAPAARFTSAPAPVVEQPSDLVRSGEYSSFHVGKKDKDYDEDDEEDLTDIKKFNRDFYRNACDDEYDDSMDQFVRFGVDDGETEDERMSLTASTGAEDDETDPSMESTTEASRKPRRNKIPGGKQQRSKYTGRPRGGKQRTQH